MKGRSLCEASPFDQMCRSISSLWANLDLDGILFWRSLKVIEIEVSVLGDPRLLSPLFSSNEIIPRRRFKLENNEIHSFTCSPSVRTLSSSLLWFLQFLSSLCNNHNNEMNELCEDGQSSGFIRILWKEMDRFWDLGPFPVQHGNKKWKLWREA